MRCTRLKLNLWQARDLQRLVLTCWRHARGYLESQFRNEKPLWSRVNIVSNSFALLNLRASSHSRRAVRSSGSQLSQNLVGQKAMKAVVPRDSGAKRGMTSSSGYNIMRRTRKPSVLAIDLSRRHVRSTRLRSAASEGSMADTPVPSAASRGAPRRRRARGAA